MSYRVLLAALLSAAVGCEGLNDLFSTKSPKTSGWSSEPPRSLSSHRDPPRDIDPKLAVPLDEIKPAAFFDFREPAPSGTAATNAGAVRR